MPRVRRLTSIAVVAGLGLLTLTGCRSDPSVAAYAGTSSFSDTQVTGIVDEFLGSLSEEQRATFESVNLRDQVLHWMVLTEVVADYAEAKEIEIPPADVEGLAQQQGLSPDIELTRVLAEYSATLGALQQVAKPVSPTEADRREAYEHTTLSNQPLSESYDQVKQFFNDESLGQSLGMRQMLDEAVTAGDVAVNPRYNATYRLPVQLGQEAQSWFAVELGESAPVNDAPVEAPPAQGQNGQG